LFTVITAGKATTMLKYSQDFALDWCQENGWTDFFVEQYRYWAFPPGAVMPLPLPADALYLVRKEKILTLQERLVYGGILLATLGTGIFTYWLRSPMPIALGFMGCAIAVALLEEG
jgi:hypothetical protein